MMGVFYISFYQITEKKYFFAVSMRLWSKPKSSSIWQPNRLASCPNERSGHFNVKHYNLTRTDTETFMDPKCLMMHATS